MIGVIIYVRFLDNSKIFKLIVSFFFAFYIGFFLNVSLNFKKCPECYGTDLCRYFQNRQIRLTWYSYALSLINSKLTKSVFFGILNGSVPIVIKNKARKIPMLNYKTFEDLQLNSENVQNVILCPGFDNVEFLLSQVNNRSETEYLWLDMEHSMEPLLKLYFQSYNWPTPIIYGTCGDFIIEEYKGESLHKFLSSEFEKKLYLSMSLLKMAQLFTFGHPEFIFYFTDYSLYNFVVDADGKLFMVDLDNVILFNRSASKDVIIHNDIHVSESLNDEQYTFSADDICGSFLSDHNFYSVCQFMLAHSEDGLLRQIPDEILRLYPNILKLLTECAIPKTTNDRIQAGQKLQSLLKEILDDLKRQ